LKPAQVNSSQDPISKISFTKRAGAMAQGEGPEFKTQYHKKKKKMQERSFFTPLAIPASFILLCSSSEMCLTGEK
jgi:hypothetical protein